VAGALGVRFSAGAAASRDRTIVVHTSASESGLAMALDLAGADGTIVEMSWFGDRRVCLPLGEAFHSRRLTIRSSQVGSIPPHRRAEWTTRRRMALALDLLRDSALDVLITGESAFDDLPEVMARLATEPGDTLCHRIRY
jgi:threonine dehydrogenase-like Zn-dependent dehydrogenase